MMADSAQPSRPTARAIVLQSIVIWGGTLVLLAVEAVVARLGLGPLDVAIPLVCAAVQLVLIALFGMQLVRERALLRLAAVAGVIWLVIMFGLTLSDFLTRGII
jgi:cytochrome c oxidase subunit 4